MIFGSGVFIYIALSKPPLRLRRYRPILQGALVGVFLTKVDSTLHKTKTVTARHKKLRVEGSRRMRTEHRGPCYGLGVLAFTASLLDRLRALLQKRDHDSIHVVIDRVAPRRCAVVLLGNALLMWG